MVLQKRKDSLDQVPNKERIPKAPQHFNDEVDANLQRFLGVLETKLSPDDIEKLRVIFSYQKIFLNENISLKALNQQLNSVLLDDGTKED